MVPLPLPHFYAALAALAAGTRDDHVRLAWFGDSHTAADFMSGEVRRRLQAKFGNGGPGFVHLGVPGVRHESVESLARGRWKRQPKSPASYRSQEDGVYGLAGMRAVALDATAEVELGFRWKRDRVAVSWEVIFRPTGKTFTWTAWTVPGTGQPRRSGTLHWPTASGSWHTRASQLLGWKLALDGEQRLRIRFPRGPVEVFGAVGETAEPGVVLDALGINGARIRTVLGWHEGTWVGELAERGPELVIFAYGTNEAGDQDAVRQHRKYYRKVAERFRTALPDTDCLLIGPTDRRGSDGQSLPRVAELDRMQQNTARDLGCAYFSLYEAMGGDGAYSVWARQEPALAGRDGVHLTRTGYQRLAEILTEQLLESYSRRATKSL